MIGCMGGEGSQWIGMEPFVESSHMFQNMGDGTFFHSGQLAIQAAVAAGVTMTYKLLWNDAVAMTGGQDAQGRVAVSRVTETLLAQGVARVVVTTDDTSRYRRAGLPPGVDVWPRSRFVEAQRVLRGTPGVTVLIHDQVCAAEVRRRRKRGAAPTPNRRVVINHRICEGCGDCGDISNCLSVQPIKTPYGRKTTIDQASCNLDYSCLEGDCPAFMTVTTGSSRRAGRPRARNTAASGPGVLPEPGVVVDADDASVRIAGIGGTGVVTASQLIATAAMFDRYEVGGLDQTGLSQKAGPVVSDVRLTKGRAQESNKLGAGRADLLLAFDQMVAATPGVLIAGDPDRTAVVGSTTVVPTGAVVSHPHEPMPGQDELAARIAAVTAEGKRHWADAGAITTSLFGDATAANVFVLGMAIQAGYLPVSVRAMEQAIELNGIAVQENVAAFRWGRTQVAVPDDVAAAVAGRTRSLPDLDDALGSSIARIADGDESLEGLVRMLAGDLVGWQNREIAASFIDEVAAVVEREREVVPDSTRLTETFARGLHKLTAYKDEYEVARLMLDPEGMEAARELAASTGGRISWRLHPPLLRALGRSSKVVFPSWSAPIFAMLARMKWMRGHWYDPFGHGEVRQTESELPGEYIVAVRGMLAGLDAGNIDRAVEVARLADIVRGYERIKMRAVAEFRARLREAAEIGPRDGDGVRS
jgi:indolepyruvate ferredoxin oxidoreductase